MPDPTSEHDPTETTNIDDATIASEESRRDAEIAREAREEAEKLEAVPYERFQKEHEDGVPEPS